MPFSVLKRELVSKKVRSAIWSVRRPPLPALARHLKSDIVIVMIQIFRAHARGENAAKRMPNRLRQGKSLRARWRLGEARRIRNLLGFVDPIDKVVDPFVDRRSDVSIKSADRDDLRNLSTIHTRLQRSREIERDATHLPR